MSNLTDSELESLKQSITEEEWNGIVNEIKKQRGGEWPPDWYIKVIAPGGVIPEKKKFITITSYPKQSA